MTPTARNLFQTFVTRLSELGTLQSGDVDSQAQQQLFASVALWFICAGALWGVAYLLFGEPLGASIPLGYAVISLVSLYLCRRTHYYRFFRSSQFLLILFLPFLLMIA